MSTTTPNITSTRSAFDTVAETPTPGEVHQQKPDSEPSKNHFTFAPIQEAWGAAQIAPPVSSKVGAKTITSTQRIFDAVCELHALEQIATRETVAELTGLKLTIVDDRLGALVDDEKLKRVLRGVYVPVEVYAPARDMSKTIVANGLVKYEIGDDVFTLTPREERMLAELTSGAMTQAIGIESSRQTSMLVTALAAELKKLKRDYEVRMANNQNPAQGDWVSRSN